MSVGKRPEVLVLLVLVLAGLGWVAWHQGGASWEQNPSQTSSQLKITGTRVLPEGTHRRVRIEFTLKHPGPTPLSALPPHVKLRDDQGRELPAFFAPGEFPPDLPADREAASWFEGWLTAEQAAGPLVLEVAGQRVPVPSR